MLQLKNRRNHYDPVHRNALVLQVFYKAGIAEGAIAFPQQVFGSIHFAGFDQELFDKQANAADILVYSPEIRPFRFPYGPAETHPNRVNHY